MAFRYCTLQVRCYVLLRRAETVKKYLINQRNRLNRLRPKSRRVKVVEKNMTRTKTYNAVTVGVQLRDTKCRSPKTDSENRS